MNVVTSTSDDVWFNLALEESLLAKAATTGPILYFYVNSPAIVIGKNQNPWRECDVARLPSLGVRFARRISGGGAVFHDRGNLNYAILMPRTMYQQDLVFAAVIEALAALGVNAELRQRTNLYAGDVKVSGSAFCFRGESALHHGTMLVDSDLTLLAEVLKPPALKLSGHGIPSRPAVTKNLSAISPDVTMERLRASLSEALGAALRSPPVACDADASGVQVDAARIAEHASWSWQFGFTPAFRAELPLREDDSLVCEVENGLLIEAAAGIRDLPEIEGVRFSKALLASRLGPDAVAKWPDF